MNIIDANELLKKFNCEQSTFANKALDYYDGNQLTHVVNLLNHPNQGRKDWVNRGMRATYRNLTNSIIDKSGLLFINGRPNIIVKDSDGVELDDETFMLHQLLNDATFEEVMVNFDSVLRLLKTVMMLVQYDNESQYLSFDVLHRGNSVVKTSGIKRDVDVVMYETSRDSNGIHYRSIDDESIQDWFLSGKSGSTLQLLSDEPNIYGRIPVSVFHDTHTPRDGFWNHIPQDLVIFNEEYNMYLVDTIYAASYANRKTLFTNAAFSSDVDESMEVQEFYGESLPRQTASGDSITAGPDKVIQIDSTGVDQVFMEYMGPDINLEEIRKLFMSLSKDVASDWSVRLKVEGEGAATSGFQVVVEEMDNMELRKQRQKMVESGLKRLLGCVKHMINIGEGVSLYSDDSTVVVEFDKPNLPVDDYRNDEMWIKRIDAGLASRVDYLMSKYNLGREEAELKIQEIDRGGLLE